MSERNSLLDSKKSNGAEYDCDFEVNMKRLDSHIIPFRKQTSRPETLFVQRSSPDSDRYESDEMKKSITKNVDWCKQLSRDVDGILPGYM